MVNYLITRKRFVLSETDLNKSSTLMHDYDKPSTQLESDLERSGQSGKLHYLGHASTSIVLGSWLDQRMLMLP